MFLAVTIQGLPSVLCKLLCVFVMFSTKKLLLSSRYNVSLPRHVVLTAGGNKQTFFHICDSWMSMSFAAWLVGQVSASVQGSDALDCSGVHRVLGLWIPRHI